MQSDTDALDLLQHTLAEIYTGRSFAFAGTRVSAAQAFASNGFLPLFAARAARRFRVVHPDGLTLERCVRCGQGAPGSAPPCVAPCPMASGQNRVTGLFTFELAASDPGNLLPLRIGCLPYRGVVYAALYFVFDAAQDVVLASHDARIVPMDVLAEDLALELDPQLMTAVEKMRLEGAPIPSSLEAMFSHGDARHVR